VEAIGALKARGVTIIYTSHYMEEVEALCDAMVVIDQGQIVAQGSKEDLLRRFAQSALMVTLERPLDDAGRAQALAIGAVWEDDVHLTAPIAHPGELARVLEMLSAAGASVVQARYGAARLEQAYLAMISQSEAA
jgi:ABC-type multidrug transport system ATPase subunit